MSGEQSTEGTLLPTSLAVSIQPTTIQGSHSQMQPECPTRAEVHMEQGQKLCKPKGSVTYGLLGLWILFSFC